MINEAGRFCAVFRFPGSCIVADETEKLLNEVRLVKRINHRDFS